MHKEIKQLLIEKIELEPPVERPKDSAFGHFATPVAFMLAKKLKRNPKEIAEALSKQLEHEYFEKIETVGGYINFHLSAAYLDRHATEALQNPQEFAKDANESSILLEYVSANPTGPLHIGHARGAVIGDSLYRVAKHLGYKIDSEYYVNDAGNQIHLLGLSIHLAAKKLKGLDVEYPESYYRGDYIDDIAKEAFEKFGDTPLDEASIPDLSEFGKELMLVEIKQNLQDVGITFDTYISEREVLKAKDSVFKTLYDNNAFYEKEGKTWIKSEVFGDEKDRVVVRETGEPTYLAGDIIYHGEKFQRKYDKYINIWGADHHGYIARVKASIKHLGYDESRLEVILAQMVSLLKNGEPYKMSKRAGNFILMKDVVEEIGKDALRYIFLSKKSDTHLEFDVEDLKKEDSSNPIYYINYAYARINTLFEKSDYTINDVVNEPLEEADFDEKLLLFEALLLQKVLEESFEKRELQKITEYLKSLASTFHSFYNKQKVIGETGEKRYLKIFSVVALSIKTGCELIGITPKEKM